MSHKLINHSPDLKKLQDEGFELEIKGGYLLVGNVPYVNSRKEIAYGTLVSELALVEDKTTTPPTHVVYFLGDHPCNNDGNIIEQIKHTSENKTLSEGIIVNHSFSNKPPEGYINYYEKITTYIKIISAQAESINHLVTAKTFKVIESNDPDIVFNYSDTNSSRADTNIVSAKLENLKIGIIGLGGTGSYILDFVAKTPVKEIHLFDGDVFLQHNAFRAPGAIPVDKLKEQPKKVAYLHEVYSKMHKHITPHDCYIISSTLEEICGLDFVFICIDDGEAKKIIVEKLLENNISFIDVGIGVEIVDGMLTGSVRVTTCTAEKNDHLNTRIPFSNKANDDYSQNIQIAELNALNASLAVIKWKKLYNYYHDLEKEHNTIYSINVSQIVNNETNS